MRSPRQSPGWISFVAFAASLSGGPALASGDVALGTSGRQVGGIPAIVGHPADQFLALMDAYRGKHRENQVMQTIAGRLTREELLALAAYYESLKPVR
jgi:hypothetical protein